MKDWILLPSFRAADEHAERELITSSLVLTRKTSKPFYAIIVFVAMNFHPFVSNVLHSLVCLLERAIASPNLLLMLRFLCLASQALLLLLPCVLLAQLPRLLLASCFLRYTTAQVRPSNQFSL